MPVYYEFCSQRNGGGGTIDSGFGYHWLWISCFQPDIIHPVFFLYTGFTPGVFNSQWFALSRIYILTIFPLRVFSRSTFPTLYISHPLLYDRQGTASILGVNLPYMSDRKCVAYVGVFYRFVYTFNIYRVYMFIKWCVCVWTTKLWLLAFTKNVRLGPITC